MPIMVSINGTWKELGKDITEEEYNEYCELKDQAYCDKITSKLSKDDFNFEVLDLDRMSDFDTLILKFPNGNFKEFVEKFNSNSDINIKVLEDNLLKVIVY